MGNFLIDVDLQPPEGRFKGDRMLLHTKCIDGVQICRLASGTVSEQYADATGNHERNYDCQP